MVKDREDIIKHMNKLSWYSTQNDFIVEIGPEFGNGSTRAFQTGFALNSSDNKIWITVDIICNIYPECVPIVPFWHFVLGDSREQSTVNKVRELCGNRFPDVIFIDTIHNYEFLKVELEVWKELAGPKTVWLFHDTWMMKKYNHMTDAIKEFALAYPQWEYKDLSKKCNGLGALVPVRKNNVLEN